VLAVVLAIGLLVTLQSVLVEGALLDLRPALVAVLWSMILLAPALAIGAPGSERGTGHRPREAPPPWCFATSDQCLARESMRLLI